MTLYTIHGTPFQIDKGNYDNVSRHVWCLAGGGYVSGNVAKDKLQVLHLFLLGPAPKGLLWDHENRDILDNRRQNLRIVTRAINAVNTGLRATNKSGVTGVSRHGKDAWQVHIDCRPLGYFKNFDDAVTARRIAEESRSKEHVAIVALLNRKK